MYVVHSSTTDSLSNTVLWQTLGKQETLHRPLRAVEAKETPELQRSKNVSVLFAPCPDRTLLCDTTGMLT